MFLSTSFNKTFIHNEYVSLLQKQNSFTMINISVSSVIAQNCPDLQIGVIEANACNSLTPERLWNELQEEASRIASEYTTASLTQRPAISATRQAYRCFGKDPARYRVSSEALCRRAIRGLELYRINTLVDLINIVSMHSGYSIGGFDADCIKGNLTLGVGQADDIFHGIGRGALNIEGLPVYRDNIGGIGTPTSDEERTKMTLETKHILICINAYAIEMPLEDCLSYTSQLLTQYAFATDISSRIIHAN